MDNPFKRKKTVEKIKKKDGLLPRQKEPEERKMLINPEKNRACIDRRRDEPLRLGATEYSDVTVGPTLPRLSQDYGYDDFMHMVPKSTEQNEYAGFLREVKKLKEAHVRYETTPIINTTQTRQGERPVVPFQLLMFYHDNSPELFSASRFTMDLVLGHGMTVNSDQDDATDVCTDFINMTSLYRKIKQVAHTSYITGFGIFSKVYGKNGELVGIDDFDSKRILYAFRDKYGNMREYLYLLKGGQVITIKEKDVKNHVPLIILPRQREAFGYSFFSSIAGATVTRDRVQVPIVEQMWSIRAAMTGVINNHASPHMFISYPNMTSKELQKQGEKLKNLDWGGKVLTKELPQVEYFQPTSTTSYDSYIKSVENSYMLGTGFPYGILTGDFTSRASSQTTNSLLDRDIQSIQNIILDTVKEEIFIPMLMRHPSKKWLTREDAMAVNLKIKFDTRIPKEYTQEQIIQKVNAGIWTVAEARQNDKNNGYELTDDDEIETQSATSEKRNNKNEKKLIESKKEIADLRKELRQVKENEKANEQIDKIIGELPDNG